MNKTYNAFNWCEGLLVVKIITTLPTLWHIKTIQKQKLLAVWTYLMKKVKCFLIKFGCKSYEDYITGIIESKSEIVSIFAR